MDIAQALEIARIQHHCVLATYRRDGSLQLSPVLAGVDSDGKVVISTRETAMKTRNLLRDPRASLCVLPDGFFGRWVQIDANVDIVHLPEAMDGLVALYRQISGEHPNWDEFREAMHIERRVLLRLNVEHAGPDRAG
ncbi:MAG: PPOX class F420-dependent oxidoreductase [Actinobacteria bacterium]|nr:PPOX class F420-dependent oxidoreductase [Actinomycetota bacterium]